MLNAIISIQLDHKNLNLTSILSITSQHIQILIKALKIYVYVTSTLLDIHQSHIMCMANKIDIKKYMVLKGFKYIKTTYLSYVLSSIRPHLRNQRISTKRTAKPFQSQQN